MWVGPQLSRPRSRTCPSSCRPLILVPSCSGIHTATPSLATTPPALSLAPSTCSGTLAIPATTTPALSPLRLTPPSSPHLLRGVAARQRAVLFLGVCPPYQRGARCFYRSNLNSKPYSLKPSRLYHSCTISRLMRLVPITL